MYEVKIQQEMEVDWKAKERVVLRITFSFLAVGQISFSTARRLDLSGWKWIWISIYWVWDAFKTSNWWCQIRASYRCWSSEETSNLDILQDFVHLCLGLPHILFFSLYVQKRLCFMRVINCIYWPLAWLSWMSLSSEGYQKIRRWKEKKVHA